MNYGNIKFCDIADGEGVRTTLFVSGCTNRCKGCFQPQTWDFDYGQPFDEAAQEKILASLAPDYIDGLTLLGGEPFEPQNQTALTPFLRRVREQYPDKTVWAYTGFLLEDLLTKSEKRTDVTDEMLSMIDVLVDGPYIEEKRSLMLQFRGSENQRVIDLRRTLEIGEAVIWGKLQR